MEIVGPVIDIISRVWSCSAVHGNYLCELKQNMSSLKISLTKLKERRDDVKEKVDIAEENPTEPKKRTHEVSGWLHRVESLEQEVESILQKEEAVNDGGSYFCCWGRKNCCGGYKLGKSVAEKMIAVEKLWEEGNFQVVVENSRPDPVREIIANQAVGMESKLEQVWSMLVDETSPVRIVGLYGMGGVGKTTILKKVNNEFLKGNHDFDKVIWVVVSKDLDVKNIQNQIGKSLGLTWKDDASIDDRAKDITQVLKKKKYVLFLDDVWERVELATIGIPNLKSDTHQEIINSSRIVFTTRSESVCGFMEADKKIKIDCLQWNEAWSLFQEKVGEQALNCHPDTSVLAKQVAKECLGLPLALITIGRTMATRTTLQQWQYAINVLRKSASEFSGVADGVLSILKFSYDNLQNEKLKSCFLYCSLYPEDYSIEKEKLIKLWIGEGFLDEVDDIDEALLEGHDIIESLKSACLLETGSGSSFYVGDGIKMHDVIRDLAIWIASDLGTKKGKFLVISSQNKLKLHEWENAEKISLAGNNSIGELNGAPNCSNLSTLLLNRSIVKAISDDFFQSMPMLKVLDMSDVSINKKLPTSINSLTELRYFDLSFRFQSSRPIELTPGTFLNLTKLKMMDLYCQNSSDICNWEVEGGPSLSELESLKDLNHLGIRLETGLAFQRLVSSHKLQLCTRLLRISKCQGITTIVLSPPSLPSSPVSPSLISLANMVSLKTLFLDRLNELQELRIEDKVTLFMNLEKLQIWDMPKLMIVWDMPQRSTTTFCFMNLKDVEILGCPKLKDMSWLIYAQNLETLDLCLLDGLEEVISDSFAAEEKLANAFSRLKRFRFYYLPKLKRICNHDTKLLSLEGIHVRQCGKLKKLPFGTNSVISNTLQSIEGRQGWWDGLEWEDEITKSNFAPYFFVNNA
ncbi:hypothetical protein MKX01_010576 [Papaver californicum]|nr:hypothetical protein MKX01_010576 [Papaver californicum]